MLLFQRAVEASYALQESVTDSPEFKRWFADSKVVDASGQPLIVYHGTGAEFRAFDLKLARKTDIKGVFFAFTPNLAGAFNASKVIAAYVRIRNPATFKDVAAAAQAGVKVSQIHTALKKKGFDGIFDTQRQLVVAFDPKQVKSADQNSGKFGNTADIYESLPDLSEYPPVVKRLLSSYVAYGDRFLFNELVGAGKEIDPYLVRTKHPLAMMAGTPDGRARMFLSELIDKFGLRK